MTTPFELFAGIKVYESPYIQPVQKIKFPSVTPLSNEVLQQTNAWLLETFGTEEVAYFFDRKMFGSPKTMGMIRGLAP